MASSPEESSPVEYVTESCCICDEEFSSDSELSNHLLDHANDEEFRASITDPDPPASSSSVPTARPVVPEFTKTSFVKDQTLQKNFTRRSTSPEVWEIVSDDSDDEKSRNPKVARLSNSFRLVSSAKQPQNNVNGESGPPFHCRTCLSVFNDMKTFKEHLLTHEKPKPYACQICNKTFAYKTTLRQHLHLHIGEKSHECRTCHKKFSIKSLLRKHEEEHDIQNVRERMNNSQMKV